VALEGLPIEVRKLVAGLALVVTTGPVPAPIRAPETGRIVGSVEVSANLVARKPRFRIYSDPGPGSIPISNNDLSNGLGVVVFLDSVSGQWPPDPDPNHAMSQEDEQFLPHVLSVVRGSTVRFPNHDPFFHNVFSLSSAASFDLGQYARGQSRSVRFDQTGIVQVFCHIHSDMSGYILVLDNPFFAVPANDGRFTIDAIPPGEYRIVAWQERARPIVRTVRIEAGRTTRVDLLIPMVDSSGYGE
jgi:plastocyanin